MGTRPKYNTDPPSEVMVQRRKKAETTEKKQETIKDCKHPDCYYHGGKTCDYCLVTGHRRGCPISKCKRYKKGSRKATPFDTWEEGCW